MSLTPPGAGSDHLGLLPALLTVRTRTKLGSRVALFPSLDLRLLCGIVYCLKFG